MSLKQFLQNFFYRYEGLDHALQCVDYIKDNGKNIGCRFPYLESPDYKDFYICVNGSSKSQLIRPSYSIFQLQDIGEMNRQLQDVPSLSHLQTHGREKVDIEIDIEIKIQRYRERDTY